MKFEGTERYIATDDLRMHVGHFDIKELFDSFSDLDLIGVPRHLKKNLLLDIVGLNLAGSATRLAEKVSFLGQKRAFVDALLRSHFYRLSFISKRCSAKRY